MTQCSLRAAEEAMRLGGPGFSYSKEVEATFHEKADHVEEFIISISEDPVQRARAVKAEKERV